MKLLEDVHQNGALIIYGTQINSLTNQNKNAALELLHNYFWKGSKVIADTAINDKLLKTNSIFLLGSHKSNKIIRKLNGIIPIKFTQSEFVFNNEKYSNSDELISLLYYNPFNSNKLLYLISGNNDKVILNNLITNRSGDIRISSNGYTEYLGFFKLNKEGKWIINKQKSKEYKSKRRGVRETENYRYISYSNISNTLLQKIISVNDSIFNKVKSFIGNKFHSTKTKFYIFNNLEDKGLITGFTGFSNIFFKDSSVQVVANNWINGDDFSKCAELLFLENFPKPKLNFLKEGISIYFSKNWQKKGYKYWASKITLSQNIPSLKELLNNDNLKFISPFISQPLSGMFIKYMIEKLGKEKFLYTFSNWTISQKLLPKLDIEWKEYLKLQAEKYKKQIEINNANFKTNVPEFQKGFCFAHVGYQIYNGYLSREAYNSLKYINDKLHANSFSITPYTSMMNANEPEPLRFWEFAGAENDESLIYIKHCADELKMTVIMKPQIYLGRSGWPGDIKMKSQQDWKKFFHYYYNWIVHYAMISEIYKIPILCLGNELSKTTVGHEQEWIELLNKIRKIYHGKIVYDANWGSEFSKLKFWDHFDYIGLSEYYPISTKDNPTDDELLKGAEKVIAIIDSVRKRYDKQIIFTEAGFRSSGEPWKTAMEESTKDSINFQNQIRCYQALFKAAYNKPWLAGMYWWKWPSYLSFNGEYFEGGDLYPPNNKPVEKTISNWYSKNWK